MLQRGKQQNMVTSVHTADTEDVTTTTKDATAAPQVLIVDDEAVIRDALRWLFEDAGYVVQEAADGRAALDVLAASTTQLVVLLDLKMPGMSGYEVLRLLADKPGWAARYAFIVMSAMSGPLGSPDVLPLLKQLSISVVSKPFEVEEILAAVDTEAARLSAMTAHDADVDATA